MMILAIDPATKTGATYDKDRKIVTELWDNSTKPKTKTREAEPKHMRLRKLWDKLHHIHHYVQMIDVIVFEGALGFQRGKSAVEASHKFRAVIELFCSLHDIKCVEIQPNDLKFFALGKRSGDKSEMIEAANRLGYEGSEDNEADSYLIYNWYISTPHG